MYPLFVDQNVDPSEAQMSTAKLTPDYIKKAPTPEAGKVFHWDEDLPGFGLMVTSSGHKSYVYTYRANGTQRRMKLKGDWLRHVAKVAKKNGDKIEPRPGETVFNVAKREAQAVRGAIATGQDPLAELRNLRNADKNSFKAVAEEFFKRDGKGLRSAEDSKKDLKRYIYSKFGSRAINEIKRSEIVRLLDQIEDKNGPFAAQHALAILRRVMNWHATRDDDFVSPIVRGMARIKTKEHARKRILDDDELRLVWRVADEHKGPYDWLLQYILLTATRIAESADMQSTELSKDGTEWKIPGARYKTKLDHLVPLSKAAQKLLAKVPAVAGKDGKVTWLFSTNGNTPISGFSKFKAAFDERVIEANDGKELERWTPHDLRRTGRSLMSRAGINADHAERCLGHVIGGIRGTYDCYEYRDEKAHAFEALAAQIERIVDPQDNVRSLRRR
jgi:integrase